MTLQINTSTGARDLTTSEQAEARAGLAAAAAVDLSAHVADTSNPHGVTKAQVGLGSVDNTADANKPVSAAQAVAIGAAVTAHIDATDPHPGKYAPTDHTHTPASIGAATAAQGATADTALQPGAQLTQAAVTAATAPGVALLGAATTDAQRTALGLGTAATTAASDYATAAQGAKADAALVASADAIADVLEAAATGAPADLARIQSSVSGAVKIIGIPAAPDFVVDAANGNDTNAGTPAAPWKSLSKVASAVTLGARKTVLVKSGAYSTVLDYIYAGPNNVYPARTELIVAFEPGCIMDGAAANAVASNANISGIDIAGSNWSATFYGNGCIVRNYADTAAWATSSPNGLAARGSATVYYYDFDVTNCDDGISNHDTARMYTTRCRAKQGEKSAFAHVSTSYWEDVDGVYYDLTGSANGSTGKSRCTGTRFYALEGSGTTVQLTFSGATLISRGVVGSMTQQLRIAHTTAGSRVDIEDSYCNTHIDGRDNVYLTRCYGRFYTRIRSGALAGGLGGKQCVWVGPSTQADVAGGGIGKLSSVGASAINWDDTIWHGFGVAIGAGFDATGDTDWNASGSAIRNNCFFGNTTNTRAGLTGISGTLTADPRIGRATGYDQHDYALQYGSPMLGAGYAGGNVGFALSEIAA